VKDAGGRNDHRATRGRATKESEQRKLEAFSSGKRRRFGVVMPRDNSSASR